MDEIEKLIYALGCMLSRKRKYISRRSSGVERFLGKEEATGSNPVVGSRLIIMSADRTHFSRLDEKGFDQQ